MTAEGSPSSVPAGLMDNLFRHREDGPIPGLLLVLTVVTGLIDSVSVLGLGRVFVANMTGNVVFLGLAVAGAPGFSLVNSVTALIGFLIGARFLGVVGARWANNRAVLLRNAAAIQAALVGVALASAASSPHHLGRLTAVVVTALCASSMGIQNAMARRLAVPDLTTTVLTMTLTGIAADGRVRRPGTTARRVLSVLTMGTGALVGALLVLHQDIVWPLVISDALLALVAVASEAAIRGNGGWLARTQR